MAVSFYGTQAWKQCRASYVKYRKGLCERCLRKGLYKPGEIVHHKTPITPDNISDPTITLSFDNLELLCRDCHADAHGYRKARYKIAPNGDVTPPLAESRGAGR